MNNLFFTNSIHNTKNVQRRGVAPVIATLLLVSIAVVGGSMVFVFAQGYFSQTQISTSMEVQYLEVIGYDTRDTSPLKIHNGDNILPANCCGDGTDDIKSPDERIAIYIQNNSIQPVTISELKLGGFEYQYTSSPLLGPWQAGGVGPQPGEYVIMTGPDGTVNGNILEEPFPRIESGGIVTLLLDLDSTLKNGRDIQVNLLTTKGNVFVSTILTGHISN